MQTTEFNRFLFLIFVYFLLNFYFSSNLNQQTENSNSAPQITLETDRTSPVLKSCILVLFTKKKNTMWIFVYVSGVRKNPFFFQVVKLTEKNGYANT